MNILVLMLYSSLIRIDCDEGTCMLTIVNASFSRFLFNLVRSQKHYLVIVSLQHMPHCPLMILIKINDTN